MHACLALNVKQVLIFFNLQNKSKKICIFGQIREVNIKNPLWRHTEVSYHSQLHGNDMQTLYKE